MKPLPAARVGRVSLQLLLITALVITGCVSDPTTTTPTPARNKSATGVPAQQITATHSSQGRYELIDAKCDERQCLFSGGGDDWPVSLGLVTLKGYYQQMEVELDNLQKINCDYFVVTDGPTEFQREFLALIDFGNSVNRRNEAGQLVLGIDLRELDPNEKDKVLTAIVEQPVSLVVLSPTPPASMGGCLTFINIIKVK